MANPSIAKAQKLMVAAAAAAAIAVPYEGVRFVAYRDTGGVLTACAGTTTGVRAGKTYTMAECMQSLSGDMLKAAQQVDACAPNAPASVLIAFSDAAYNLGPKIACNTAASTAARYLKAGRWADACRELPKWSKASLGGALVTLPGLAARREAEMKVCLEGLA